MAGYTQRPDIRASRVPPLLLALVLALLMWVAIGGVIAAIVTFA